MGYCGDACPNGYPDPLLYVPITREAVCAHLSSLAVASMLTHNAPLGATGPSTALSDALPNTETMQPCPNNVNIMYTGSFIEPVSEVENLSGPSSAEMHMAAVVLPLSVSFILGSGDSPDMSDDNCSLGPEMCPISVPHLVWQANFFGHNEFPVPFDCLLDNGAHLVLIRPETVVDLALPVCKLKESVFITITMQSSKKVTLFYDYICFPLPILFE